MKNIFKIIILMVFCSTIFAQINKNDIRSRISLKGPVEMSDSLHLQLLAEQILQLYGNSFNFYEELKSGSYTFKIQNRESSGYSLQILTKDKITVELNVDKQKSTLGGYVFSFSDSEIEKLITKLPKAYGFSSKDGDIITIIERNNILIDKDILPIEELQPDERKILDRQFTMDNFKDQFDNDLELFKLCQAGKFFPYSGGHSKLVTVDNEYSSLIFFDEGISEDDGTPINQCYGYLGDDANEFNNPLGFCYGRMITVGDDDIYPVYIADKNNLRIRLVNFVVDRTFVDNAAFDKGSFRDVAVITYPYDICYFKNSLDSTQDKLWVTQAHPTQNFLTCLSKDGAEIQKFSGYKNQLTGMTYFFQPGTLSRIDLFNNGFGALCFIDNARNFLVTCLLNDDGTAGVEYISDRDDYLLASQVVVFPSADPLTSISFLKTPLASPLWPSVWVTSQSYIHHLKMNKSAYVQYLASTKLPRNSLEYFTNLRNTICTYNVYDIYTIENWSNSRGLRKYYVFADIHSETLENYCDDSTDVMRFKATFTNDCWIQLSAKRKNRQGNWETVKIKKFNGSEVNSNSVIKWQFAGWNQASYDLYVDLQLDLPMESYVLNDSVSLIMKIYPEYSNPVNYPNDEHLSKEYKAIVANTCLPKPGGCPFLYVKDENNNFTPDNNLLHKMEYSTPSTDITDKYKLRIKPIISGGKIETYIVENEDDLSLIDQVRMYAVDYPPNRKVAVTEYNQVVLYDSAAAYGADTVLQNYTVNVTNDLHFHHPGAVPLVGNAGDSMYAHFNYFVPRTNKTKENTDRTDRSKIETKTGKHEERAFSKQKYDKILTGIGGANLKWAFISDIGNLTYPVPDAKDTAGLLTATSVYNNIASGIFSRRELNSVVVLPLFTDTDMVNNIDIKWQSDHRMKYLGIAALEYGGYDINELSLAEAKYITTSLDSEITAIVLDIDGEYTEVSPSSLLKMKFDASGLPELTHDYKREYVIEVTGQYSGGQSSDFSRKSEEIPLTYRLSQNYPNPFNPVTKINYELPKNSNVNLVIYDILGREVIRLLNNEFKQPGRHTVEFDGKNFASGIYFYRIEADNFVQSKKMVLVK